MRLDKFVSNNSEYTRSQIRKLVKAERIQVNGDLVDDVALKIKSKKDVVTIDGKHIVPIGSVYYMLNKPIGYVCANEDSSYPTVLDLIKKKENGIGLKGVAPIPYKDLQIAGRLDVDTTGLVLITNDGDWNHRVTSPNASCKKVYRVSLDEPFNINTLKQFTQGMALEGEKKPTKPAAVELITPKKLRLTISEGKYHQVKRMFAATGNKVKKLHRESIGDIMLDPGLEPGQFRCLTSQEINTISQTHNSITTKL